MIYKAIKRIYPITSALSLCAFFLYAGTADYYTNELRSSIPEIAYSVMIWGVALMIPAGLFVILDYIKKKYIDGKE